MSVVTSKQLKCPVCGGSLRRRSHPSHRTFVIGYVCVGCNVVLDADYVTLSNGDIYIFGKRRSQALLNVVSGDDFSENVEKLLRAAEEANLIVHDKKWLIEKHSGLKERIDEELQNISDGGGVSDVIEVDSTALAALKNDPEFKHGTGNDDFNRPYIGFYRGTPVVRIDSPASDNFRIQNTYRG